MALKFNKTLAQSEDFVVAQQPDMTPLSTQYAGRGLSIHGQCNNAGSAALPSPKTTKTTTFKLLQPDSVPVPLYNVAIVY